MAAERHRQANGSSKPAGKGAAASAAGCFGGRSLAASFFALQLLLGVVYLPIQEVLMGKREVWELAYAPPEVSGSDAYIGGSEVEWSVGASGNAEDRLAAYENGWLDLGEGCCRNPDGVPFLFVQDFDRLEDCKRWCLSVGNCGYVEYGWALPTLEFATSFKTSTGWRTCRALPHGADCSRRDAGAFDCGSAGDNGVHAYRNLAGAAGAQPVPGSQKAGEGTPGGGPVGEAESRAPAVLPADVTLPETWTGPYDGPAETRRALLDTTFGFYLPVFNQVPGVLAVIKNVRKFYPEAPFFLLSDGGKMDFSGVCALPKYNCTFEWAEPENCRWNPHCWLSRMRIAGIRLATEYIVYLEPDVILRRRHNIQPAHDAGGLYDNFNPRMHHETTFFMQQRGQQVNPCFKVRWHHFGLAGGSYFRTAAVMDAFDPQYVSLIDWEGLLKVEGKRVFSSDFAMHVAFSQRGYTVFPWKEVSQKFSQGMRDRVKDVDDTTFGMLYPSFNTLAAFEHNHKESYKDKVPDEEKALLGTVNQSAMWKPTTCTGCVWYEGSVPSSKLPIPSKPPAVADEHVFVRKDFKHGQMHPDAPEPEDVCFGAGAARAVAQPGEQGKAREPRWEPVPLRDSAGGVGGLLEAEPPPLRMPEAVANSQGLPVSPDPAPPWMTKADDLVVDLPKSTIGGRKMLLAQTVLMNKNNVWGDASAGDRVTRPRWLRACLASNRIHTATHGHAHILRTRETLEIPQRDQEKCAKKSDEAKCLRSAAHETFNWEKHRMMLEYLSSPENFSHVMVLDADAALVHHAHDTMSIMAAELAAAGKDFLLTNEDWMGPGAGTSRINGGMLFAANTPFTKALFEDMLDAHLLEEGIPQPRLGGAQLKCHSNEQLCLNALQKRPAFASRTLLTSGIRFNRGGCVLTRCGSGKGDPDLQMKNAGLKDPTLEIMHFVGNSKYVAPKAMCEDGHDLTGGGPNGYGCAE